MKRKKIKRKLVLSAQRQGNLTSVVAAQRKPVLDKKAALKSKIQDILRGRSRFVIRKVPSAGPTTGRDSSRGGNQEQGNQRTDSPSPSLSRTSDDMKKDRFCPYHSLSMCFYKNRQFGIKVLFISGTRWLLNPADMYFCTGFPGSTPSWRKKRQNMERKRVRM